MVQTERKAAPLSAKAFSGLWAQLTLALVGGACLDLPKHECTRDLGLRRRARVSQADRPTFLPG